MARKKTGSIYINAQLGLAQIDKDVRKLEAKLDTAAKQFNKKFKAVALPTSLNQSLELAQKGFSTLGIAYSTLRSAVDKGQSFTELSNAFEKLYGQSQKLGNDGLGRLQEALSGTVAKIDILKTANLAGAAGVNSEQLLQVAKAAETLGDAIGKGPAEAYEDLVRSLSLGQEKLAKNYGLIVDNTKANYDYAKSIGKSVKDLSEREKLEAYRVDLLNQMQKQSAALATETNTAADKFEQLDAALTDAQSVIGEAINNSELLATGIKGITEAVRFGILAVTDYKSALDKVFDAAKSNLAEKIQHDAGVLRGSLVASGFRAMTGIDVNPILNSAYEKSVQIQNDLTKSNTNATKENTNVANQNELTKRRAAQEAAQRAQEETKRLDEHNSKLREAATEISNLREKWSETLKGITDQKLHDSINAAIKIQDRAGFDAALQQLAQSAISAHSKEVAEAITKNIITQEQADQYFATLRDNTTKPFIEDFEQQGEELLKRLGEKQREEYEKGISFWRNTFQNAITGVSFDLKDSLQQIAVGAAAEVANSLFGSLGGISSPQDLGGALAQQVLGALGGGSGGGLGSILGVGGGTSGIGPVASGDAYGLSLSTGLSSGTATALTSLANFASIAAIAHGGMELANNLMDNERDWKGGAQSGAIAGAGLGTLIMPGLGTLVGAAGGGAIGAALGGLIGSDVARNPDTRARHQFANWLEEQIHNLERFSFVSQNGQLQTIAGQDFNLLEGSTSRFNGGEITSQLLNYGDKAFATFTGLGEALKETLGIAEDVGGQIGLILADQFSGNIDNARLLVQQLGLSYDDLAAKLEQAALRGEQRWAEFNVQIAGLKEAFEPGLEAVGAFRQAYDNFTRSGGRGIEPVKALRDLMIEAKEAGITSLGALQNQLIATGAEADAVNAIFTGLSNAGITTLDQLSGLSDVQIGALVGNIESLSASLTQEWTSVGQQIDDINAKLANIPAELPVRIKIQAIGDIEALDTLNTLSGGSAVDFSEPGTDSIKALRKSGGRVNVNTSSAVGKATIINVDARGAAPGAEAAIINAMKTMEERVVRRSVNAVANGMRRGRF